MGYREFLDERGATWRVWDTYPDASRRLDLSDLRGGWLTFEHDTARRRLVPAPMGWVEASDATLRRWLRTATPVTVRAKNHEVSATLPAVSGPRNGATPHGEIPRVDEDPRKQIERSRETLDLLDRAIQRGHESLGDPPDERWDRDGRSGR